MPASGVAVELASVALFARVEPSVLATLEAHSFIRRLSRGQILFVAGEPTDHLYLLRRGRVRVQVTSEQGDQLVLAVLGPGESLGDIGIIDRGVRSADVIALEACELLCVPAAAIHELLSHSPAAMQAVAESLAAGMRRLTEQAADLVFLDLPRRLAKLLLGAARPDRSGDVIATLGVTQSELAARLGVTRQSLNRSLGGLSRRGWIEVDGTSVRLVDTAALSRFVHS